MVEKDENKEKKLQRLGEKIKKGRNNQKLTLKTLGQKIGYSASIISRWERGLKEPKYMAIKALEKELNIKF